MLSQKYRFHSRGGVNFVYQKGTSYRTSTLNLITHPNARGFQRFAVVVSKKVLKSAVGRNRIRRRIYEAIRLELPHLPPARDYIFVVHSNDYTNLSFLTIRQTIRQLVDRIE